MCAGDCWCVFLIIANSDFACSAPSSEPALNTWRTPEFAVISAVYESVIEPAFTNLVIIPLRPYFQ